jgi:hypothetical protein
MGYSTDFEGSFEFSKPLTVAQYKYLVKFAETRHVKKFLKMTETLPSKELKELNDLGLDIGLACEYYLGDRGEVKDSNVPPATQPGLYCQWVPNEDGTELQWDGGEKFYHYVEWLEYYIKNFFNRWDIKLNGKVEFWGERGGDHGFIIVNDNVVSVVKDGDKIETKKTNVKFNLHEYLGTLLGKKIISIGDPDDNTILVKDNDSKIKHLTRSSIDSIKNRKIILASLYLYTNSLTLVLYLELGFEGSTETYLVNVKSIIKTD